ncbi:unnamed protein product [Peronospora belbahrii]|uniref:AAA+ ATPase domain-containing protein n=1 Tax=Peronospora belbahrii TaxID=622444 RepID=A0AAU9KYM0_9STRA|nr:unnamed protein product [Peronospora belbahrii]CAH0516577.1 unnamed protein product [Peronospora belbahrii]
MDTLCPVHVEVRLKQESVVDYEQIRAGVDEYLGTMCTFFTKGVVILPETLQLSRYIDNIVITEFDGDVENEKIPQGNAQLFIHIFKLSDQVPAEETADDDESVTTCQQTILPAASFDGLWDSLVFDSCVKKSLLEYAMTAMFFSDIKVNPHIISWNRVVLLHGPPGTGKTSLCKSLAQKLSIRLSSRYPCAVLLEINAHSLFSKWFSESGKLVMKLFRQIQELVEDEESFICVMIDEVESLTAARKSAVSGSEPSDAIRVVNALLTQLDLLKRRSNVLVLTTSNITEAIDVAFVDRADIKQYIGLPSCHARYEILRSCVEELRRVSILQSSTKSLLTYQEIIRRRSLKKRVADQMSDPFGAENSSDDLELSMRLLQAAEMAEGFSGRALRKLPFQTHAFFVQTRTTLGVAEFIHYLMQTIDREKKQKQELNLG